MKSIRLKLILVLVAVCGIQALLVAGIVRYATVDAFDRFLFLDRIKDLSRAQELDQLLVLPFAGMNLSQNHRERQS